MSTAVTAQQIIDRIRKNGSGSSLHAGGPDTPVAGIATTYTPTLEVLRKAVDGGKNMIVSREAPYWSRNPKSLAANPTFVYKRDFIEKNRLVLVQLRDGEAAGPDRYLRGLADALGWDKFYLTNHTVDGEPHAPDNVYFRLPGTTLEALARYVQSKLNIRAARVLGDPQTKVSKIALTHDRMRVPALQKILKEPGVDAVIIGEPIEWEASPYFQDLIASGQKKGLIAIGLEASEEPGGRLITAWLKSFIPEIPIEWIPAGEPFSVLK